jgi:F-type H+-transporting ATPase subunit gamma
VSATIAGLRRKIASAGDLQSVVRAMKAQAAASIAQYERSVAALADYQRTVSLGLGVCIRGQAVVPPPPDRRQRTIKIVVFGSDQGLVGRFNDLVADLATSLAAGHASGPVAIWTVGQRVRELMVDAGKAIEYSFDVPSSVDAITSFVGQLFVADEALLATDRLIELYLVYNEIAPSATYRPVSVQLLPLDDSWREREAAEPWPTSGLPEVLATNAETLAAFIREYLFVSLFRACAESLASENSSRLAAMQRAEKNIDGLLDTLGGEFHRLRQASIDEELFDVVAGYEALRSDTNRLN